MKKYTLYISLVIVVLFAACKKEKSQYQLDVEEIGRYVAHHNITDYQLIEPGILIKVVKPGNMAIRPAADTSKVAVYYKMFNLWSDTPTYETPNGNLDLIDLTEYIAGWRYAMPYVGLEGEIHMIIPSMFTGGVDGVPNTILRYEVRLRSIFYGSTYH